MSELSKYINLYKSKKDVFNSIAGWCTTEQFFELEFILSYLDRNEIKGDIIELGVYTGKSAGIFNNHIHENETLKLVDCCFRHTDVTNNVMLLSGNSNFQVFNNDTWCIDTFPKNTAKLIHIDADHSYDHCWNDLYNSLPLLKEDGIIIVDDFFMDIYPQVTEATYPFIKDPQNDLAMFLYAGHKAYICKRSQLHNITDYIVKNFVDYIYGINEPYYLNKSSTFGDSSTMSIIPLGDNDIPSRMRGLDYHNEDFPSDY